MTRRSVFIALMLTGLFILGFLALLAALGPDWSAYVPASCTATRCFCEAPRTGTLLLQPANTWSSFGYVLIGSLILALPYGRDPNSALSGISGRTLGVTAIVVGVGSGLLHATLTLWGHVVSPRPKLAIRRTVGVQIGVSLRSAFGESLKTAL